MFGQGVKVWPPNWVQTEGPDTVRISGEVGELESVVLSEVDANKIYVLIYTKEGNRYLGVVMFPTADSAKRVFYFLRRQISKPLTTIGALDLPENFPD
jgi:hypothetical protein